MRKRLLLPLILLLIGCGTAAAADQEIPGILYTRPLESVIFRHQDHARKGSACVVCHTGLFEMEALHVQKNKDYNMESLYKGKYCGACHNGKKAFAADTQCARCHLGSGVVAPPKDAPPYKKSVVLGRGEQSVTFYHEVHAQKTTCRSCHPSLFKPGEGTTRIGMADHGGSRFCFGCHSGRNKDAFAWRDCSRCHRKSVPAPRETIHFGKGTKAVPFTHAGHQLKGGCKVCHPRPFAYRKGTAKIDFDDHRNRKACFACHAKKNGSAFYDCNRCHQDKPAAKPGGPDTLKYQTPWKNVYFHHESHAGFSCASCHPAPFAMKKGKTKMVMSDMLRGKTCGVCHNGTKAFSARECARCHKK